MKKKEKDFPSLWECFKDIKSFKDFRNFLPLLIPMSVYRAWKWIRHPIYRWHIAQKNRWAKSIKTGDWVCNCVGKHVTVLRKRDEFTVECDDGGSYDLYHCCDEIRPDNTCHSTTEVYA